MQIKYNEISIVVQGKVYDEYTKKCLESIRRILPGAEIILSTWENSKVDDLDYDKLVLSKDIGGGSIDSLGICNNINRQLVSTKNGLSISKRKYIFKFRSDMYLTNSLFLKIYEQYFKKSRIFKQRLLICDYYTRNPRVIPMPFHISDWILFGLSVDVKKYYNLITLQSYSEDTWFLNHKNNHSFFKAMLTRYAPEQYMCINFFRKYYDISCVDYADNTTENLNLTEKIIAENFLIVDSKKHGIIFQKYSPNRFKEKFTIISFSDWLNLYNFYINKQNIYFYKIKCFIKHLIYFYLRRLFSRLFDILGIKNALREIFY